MLFFFLSFHVILWDWLHSTFTFSGKNFFKSYATSLVYNRLLPNCPTVVQLYVCTLSNNSFKTYPTFLIGTLIWPQEHLSNLFINHFIKHVLINKLLISPQKCKKHYKSSPGRRGCVFFEAVFSLRNVTIWCHLQSSCALLCITCMDDREEHSCHMEGLRQIWLWCDTSQQYLITVGQAYFEILSKKADKA